MSDTLATIQARRDTLPPCRTPKCRNRVDREGERCWPCQERLGILLVGPGRLPVVVTILVG